MGGERKSNAFVIQLVQLLLNLHSLGQNLQSAKTRGFGGINS